jgi:phosphohistidine phosphatase
MYSYYIYKLKCDYIMKKLYLLRHAASQFIHTVADCDREISSRGIEELEELTAILSKRNFSVNIALCSTAIRTKQTWKYISEKLSLDSEEEFLDALYNTSTEVMLELISNLSAQYDSAIIISHNPTISEFANNLLHNNIGILNFGTANIACINFNVRKWQEVTNKLGKLEWFI